MYTLRSSNLDLNFTLFNTSSNVILYNDVKDSIFIKSGFPLSREHSGGGGGGGHLPHDWLNTYVKKSVKRWIFLKDMASLMYFFKKGCFFMIHCIFIRGMFEAYIQNTILDYHSQHQNN